MYTRIFGITVVLSEYNLFISIYMGFNNVAENKLLEIIFIVHHIIEGYRGIKFYSTVFINIREI